MMKRRTVAWLLAVAVGMSLVPAVDAMASKKSEKRQDARIGKVNSRLSSAIKAAGKVTKKVATLSTSVTNQGTAIVTLTTTVGGIDTRLKAIETAAPQIVAGLGQLKDGLTTVGTGLTTVGDGLTKLASNVRAVEYGSAGVYAGTTQVGPFINSSDIPDDGNGASASGSFPTTTLPAGTPLQLKAAIRSNESDGAATGDPAGQVGGLLYATCASAAGCPTAGPTLPAGTIGCTAGPPPNSPFVTPAGTLQLALVNIQQKDSETDPTTPSSTETDATGGNTCTIPGTGTWVITAQAQFFDLPTSATPGPTD